MHRVSIFNHALLTYSILCITSAEVCLDMVTSKNEMRDQFVSKKFRMLEYYLNNIISQFLFQMITLI